MSDRATRARMSAPLGPYADGCQTAERNGVTRRVRRRALPEPFIVTVRGRTPQLHAKSLVAPNATLIGQVALAARASVCTPRRCAPRAAPIEIGFDSNIQDGVTIHVDAEFPVSVGSGVSVGHNAVLHGCTVEDDSWLGIGAIVLNGAVVGAGSLVAAGARVPQGVVVPARSLVTGVPGGCGAHSATPKWLTTGTTRRSTNA